MSLYQNKRDPLFIVTEYKKHMELYSKESERLILFVRRLLENFSSSPIIPPEIIESLVNKGHLTLSDFCGLNQLFYETISAVESMDFSAVALKTNMQKNQVKIVRSVQEGFREAIHASESIIKKLKSLCTEVCFVDDYWCKQHWLNGKSRFCKSNIDYILDNFEYIQHNFWGNCSCLLEELCFYTELHANETRIIQDMINGIDDL